MNNYKIENLVAVMLTQSKYYQNFIAKFNFVSMLDYKSIETDIEKKDLIISSPSSNILYLVDIENPHHYIQSILGQDVFPIPIFHHVWHQRGIVGTDQMYNTMLADDLYLSLINKAPSYNNFCFLFDGQRFDQKLIDETSKYDNMWQVYDEMLPSSEYLKYLKVDKVKLICDKKRSDLIIAATNLYDDRLEIEVIK